MVFLSPILEEGAGALLCCLFMVTLGYTAGKGLQVFAFKPHYSLSPRDWHTNKDLPCAPDWHLVIESQIPTVLSAQMDLLSLCGHPCFHDTCHHLQCPSLNFCFSFQHKDWLSSLSLLSVVLQGNLDRARKWLNCRQNVSRSGRDINCLMVPVATFFRKVPLGQTLKRGALLWRSGLKGQSCVFPLEDAHVKVEKTRRLWQASRELCPFLVCRVEGGQQTEEHSVLGLGI